MARARLTNSGEVIRPTEDPESTEAETPVNREFEGGSVFGLDERGLMIGGREIPMNIVLIFLLIVDILISAGVILDE